MARSRFYYVRRAEDLAAAKTKLELWERKTRAEKTALYQAQITTTGNKKSDRGRVGGYIVPFGIEQAKKVFLNVWLIADAPSGGDSTKVEPATALINALKAAVYTGTPKYADTTAPTGAGNYLLDFKKQMSKLANVSLSEAEGASQTLTSRITGVPYTYRKTSAVSCVFGQKIGTPSELFATSQESENLLKTARPNASLSFKPQGNLKIGVTSA